MDVHTSGKQKDTFVNSNRFQRTWFKAADTKQTGGFSNSRMNEPIFDINFQVESRSFIDFIIHLTDRIELNSFTNEFFFFQFKASRISRRNDDGWQHRRGGANRLTYFLSARWIRYGCVFSLSRSTGSDSPSPQSGQFLFENRQLKTNHSFMMEIRGKRHVYTDALLIFNQDFYVMTGSQHCIHWMEQSLLCSTISISVKVLLFTVGLFPSNIRHYSHSLQHLPPINSKSIPTNRINLPGPWATLWTTAMKQNTLSRAVNVVIVELQR